MKRSDLTCLIGGMLKEFVQSIIEQLHNTADRDSIPFNLKEPFVIFMVTDRLLSVRGCELGFDEAGSKEGLPTRFVKASTRQAPLSFIELEEAVRRSEKDLKEHFGPTKTAKRTLLDAKTLALQGFEILSSAARSAQHVHVHELFDANYAPRQVTARDVKEVAHLAKELLTKHFTEEAGKGIHWTTTWGNGPDFRYRAEKMASEITGCALHGSTESCMLTLLTHIAGSFGSARAATCLLAVPVGHCALGSDLLKLKSHVTSALATCLERSETLRTSNMPGGMLQINLREQLAMAVSVAHFVFVWASQGAWPGPAQLLQKFLDHSCDDHSGRAKPDFEAVIFSGVDELDELDSDELDKNSLNRTSPLHTFFERKSKYIFERDELIRSQNSNPKSKALWLAPRVVAAIRLSGEPDALSFCELLRIAGLLSAKCNTLRSGGSLTVERTLLGSVALALEWIEVLCKAAIKAQHVHVHELFGADNAPRQVTASVAKGAASVARKLLADLTDGEAGHWRRSCRSGHAVLSKLTAQLPETIAVMYVARQPPPTCSISFLHARLLEEFATAAAADAANANANARIASSPPPPPPPPAGPALLPQAAVMVSLPPASLITAGASPLPAARAAPPMGSVPPTAALPEPLPEPPSPLSTTTADGTEGTVAVGGNVRGSRSRHRHAYIPKPIKPIDLRLSSSSADPDPANFEMGGCGALAVGAAVVDDDDAPAVEPTPKRQKKKEEEEEVLILTRSNRGVEGEKRGGGEEGRAEAGMLDQAEADLLEQAPDTCNSNVLDRAFNGAPDATRAEDWDAGVHGLLKPYVGDAQTLLPTPPSSAASEGMADVADKATAEPLKAAIGYVMNPTASTIGVSGSRTGAPTSAPDAMRMEEADFPKPVRPVFGRLANSGNGGVDVDTRRLMRQTDRLQHEEHEDFAPSVSSRGTWAADALAQATLSGEGAGTTIPATPTQPTPDAAPTLGWPAPRGPTSAPLPVVFGAPVAFGALAAGPLRPVARKAVPPAAPPPFYSLEQAEALAALELAVYGAQPPPSGTEGSLAARIRALKAFLTPLTPASSS